MTFNDPEGTYQMQFDEHLCDISHCFNRRGASRGPSAIAELLVYTSDNTRVPCISRGLLHTDMVYPPEDGHPSRY